MSLKKPLRKIAILGARIDGHAGVILDTIHSLGTYEIVGFIDNKPQLQGETILGIPVIGSTDTLERLEIEVDCVHIAIGDNVARGTLHKILQKMGFVLETLIHPSAVISSKAIIGEGCFIAPRAVINNGTQIGAMSIINTGAIVDHDNQIGYAVHIAPGTSMAGRVRIDDFAFLGVGSTVLPDIHIGSGAMIGAGSTVVKDVSDKTTVIGYAARKHVKNIYSETRPDVEAPHIWVAQPTLPAYSGIEEKFRDIAASLKLSNFARYAQLFEHAVEDLLQVKKALTFPNGTSALMLTLKALNLTGEIILPSFTFSATGHAVVWNGLTPIFADIDPKTFNLDPDDVERKITSKTSAIMAVHIFGNPCRIESLERIAHAHKLKLIFDSAHALGSSYKGIPIGGFGDAECFSLSGTKVVTSAEGGIVTSNDQIFMNRMRLGRNYGAEADYDCQFIGLNGKMSEFHAAIALESIAQLDTLVPQRNALVDRYRNRLSELPGIRFQRINDACVSTYKDLAIIIDPEQFGMTRDKLDIELAKEHIHTKKYFYPPLHRMKAYQSIEHRSQGLENTDAIANNILCLPLYSHMSVDTLEKVCYAIYRIYNQQKRIR